MSLETCYAKLKACPLVIKKDTSFDAIIYFQTILNDAQPSCEHDAVEKRVVQTLFRSNKNQFTRFIERNVPHFILWTEARFILRHFDLVDAINLRFNVDKQLYAAYPRNNNEAFEHSQE